MKNPPLAQYRAQQLADSLLLVHYSESEGARAHHKAQAAKAWNELKEVME